MSNEHSQTHLTEKTLNDVPGFLCPSCKQVHIKISLPQFLSASSIVCPVCGTSFEMDKSGCAGLVEVLQDLNIATENVRSMDERK